MKKIHSTGDKYTVDGVPGYYSRTVVRAFNQVKYWPPAASEREPGAGTRAELVASVSAGVYGGPGVASKPNPDAEADIRAAILKHAEGIGQPS